MALRSRLAIIAGGFGGLGYATGLKLQAQGAKLALLYAPFEADREKQVRENFARDAKDEFWAYECDITSPDSVQSAFESISKSLKEDNSSPALKPTILVNAAGYVTLYPFEDTPPSEILKHLHINILGPMLVSQAFGRMYFESTAKSNETAQGTPHPHGRIVSIASQAAHVALDDHGAYCASKAGLIGLNNCMASEWGPRGITSNTVSPGPIMTELGKRAWADKVAREKYQANIPIGRFGEPHEVADTIAFLCSDEADAINGVDIKIEGGFTVR